MRLSGHAWRAAGAKLCCPGVPPTLGLVVQFSAGSLAESGEILAKDAPDPSAPTGQSPLSRYLIVSITRPLLLRRSRCSPELSRCPSRGPREFSKPVAALRADGEAAMTTRPPPRTTVPSGNSK